MKLYQHRIERDGAHIGLTVEVRPAERNDPRIPPALDWLRGRAQSDPDITVSYFDTGNIRIEAGFALAGDERAVLGGLLRRLEACAS